MISFLAGIGLGCGCDRLFGWDVIRLPLACWDCDPMTTRRAVMATVVLCSCS